MPARAPRRPPSSGTEQSRTPSQSSDPPSCVVRHAAHVSALQLHDGLGFGALEGDLVDLGEERELRLELLGLEDDCHVLGADLSRRGQSAAVSGSQRQSAAVSGSQRQSAAATGKQDSPGLREEEARSQRRGPPCPAASGR